MKTFKYRAVADIALSFFKENGMELQFDPALFNGLLIVEAPDRETAEKIRMTYSDLTMWELIED
jgi:hypothetical protein